MKSAAGAVLWSLVVLGCAQTQVAPGKAPATSPPDAGAPVGSGVAPPANPVVPGAPPLVHFDPSLVDSSIDPCTDWYAHVCSRWMAANPIPAAEAEWGTVSNLEIWNETVLRNALEGASRADAQRSPAERKIGDYWAACVDEPGIESAGGSPIAADLARIGAIRSKRAIAGRSPGSMRPSPARPVGSPPTTTTPPQRSSASARSRTTATARRSLPTSTRAGWVCPAATSTSRTTRR